jgi:hypothetical protein
MKLYSSHNRGDLIAEVNSESLVRTVRTLKIPLLLRLQIV